MRNGERAAVAENIAEFGKIFGGDLRKPLAANQFNIFVGAFVAACAAAKFGRDDVRAEEGAHDVEGLKAFEFAKGDKDFAFAGPVEAVAGFGFEGGCAVTRELREMCKGAGCERCGGSAAEFADAIDNATSVAGDFLVGGAGDALLVFSGTRAGVDEVGVRIDESGENNAAVEVEFAGAAGFGEAFDAAAQADGGDAAFANEERAIAKNARVGERASAVRRGPAEGENFRAIGDEPGIQLARIRHFGFGCSRY